MGPVLDDLLITGVQENSLNPAFAPNRVRYSVLAEEPAQIVALTAFAAPDLELAMNGEPIQSGEPMELAELVPGSEISVEVATADEAEPLSTTYTVVYLPADFPEITNTALNVRVSPDPIYVSLNGPSLHYLAKLDNYGVPLFHRAESRRVYDFKKHPGGQLSYALTTEKVVLDAAYDEVERVRTVGLSDTDSHEFHIEPNGNYILMAYERVQRDLTAFGLAEDQVVADGILQELSPSREILFEWNSWEHMPYAEKVTNSTVDYAHLNSVDVDTDGNWIVSSRGMSQVLKIDRTTGAVIWRLGGMANDFTFVDDPYGNLCAQHTASRLANGNLLVFDNGQFCWPNVAERGQLTRIVEYALDEQAMTAELVWSYHREGVYSGSQGSAQRLANGNTLIGWGNNDAAALATEVDPQGNVVLHLEARSAAGEVESYRALRFAD